MLQAKTVLFVCTGNTCRSFMAETIARHYLKRRGWEKYLLVRSAGTATQAGLPASSLARMVMKKLGMEPSEHQTTCLSPQLAEEADLILCMTQGHLARVRQYIPVGCDKIYSLKGYALGLNESTAGQALDILDPFGLSEESYRLCAKELENYVPSALERFIR